MTETRGERNIRWIEDFCYVPDGKFGGQKIKLREFQKDIVRGIYDQTTRRAIISVGRKNAKTSLAAMLLLLHLAGPEARQNSELYSTATTRDQAAFLFRSASKIVRLSPGLRDHITIRETIKQLHCAEFGTLYCALSADASANFGLNPVFIVHDELGQVRGQRHTLYEALETATGAQEHPLSIIISTQAPTDGDLLSILIDDAKKKEDPKVRLFLWQAEKDADPFIEETIRQANPAFGDFQDKDETMAMAADAKRMPSREAEYRNLILNQRVQAESPFISPSVWEENSGEPENWGPVFGGLDLSETGDLTAFVMISPVKGVINIKPIFWLPIEGLRERSDHDRVPYDTWYEQGFLRCTPGKAVAYEYVAEEIVAEFAKNDIRKIAFDRYNMKHLVPWLVKAGLSESFIESKFEPFGQGYVSMSPAIRTLETMLLNGKMRHGNNPILTHNCTMCRIHMDAKGNRTLDKKRSTGRIDGMVALAMAADICEKSQIEGAVYPIELDKILEA